MSETVYDFVLTGTKPLLLHADNIDAADEVQAWQLDPTNKNVSVKGDDRTPPWRWTGYVYSDGEHFAMPSENVMASLRGAGAKISIPGKRGSLKRETQSGIVPPDVFFKLLIDGQQVPERILAEVRGMSFADQKKFVREYGFELWPKRAKVGQAKHIRVRPRIARWQVIGSVAIVAPEFTDARVQELFRLAGKEGLGDWRPSSPKSPGPYGMFVAEVTKRK